MGIIFPNSSISTNATVSGQPFLVASKLVGAQRTGAYIYGALDPVTSATDFVRNSGYIRFDSYFMRRSSDTFSPTSANINILQDGVYFAFFKGQMVETAQNKYVSIRRNGSSSNPTEVRVYSSGGSEYTHTFAGGGFFKCYRGDTMSVYNVNATLYADFGFTTFMVVRV